MNISPDEDQDEDTVPFNVEGTHCETCGMWTDRHLIDEYGDCPRCQHNRDDGDEF